MLEPPTCSWTSLMQSNNVKLLVHLYLCECEQTANIYDEIILSHTQVYTESYLLKDSIGWHIVADMSKQQSTDWNKEITQSNPSVHRI